MTPTPRKSILILPRWYPNRFDVQLGNFIRQQAVLLKEDFDVHVIFVQADPALKSNFQVEEYSKDGIHEWIVYYKTGRGLFSKLVNTRRAKKAQQLAYEKIKQPISLCHVHVPYRSAMLALQLRRTKNIPFVITEHWSGHLNGQYQQKNKLDKALYKSVLEKASGISCVSQLLSQKFKANTGFDSVVIPNYIDFFPLSDDKNEDGKIHLLSVSDMVDQVKNISGLIHAFHEALKTNPHLHLTLIGGGPDEEKMLSLIADLNLKPHLSFRGRQPHEAVLHEMNQCDFYLCNSNTETFGMTVAEALRCGKPVISTRCGGPEEFLTPENSIQIAPANQKELTEAILKMADSYSTYPSEKLARDIEHRFGKETVRKQLVTFYHSVI